MPAVHSRKILVTAADTDLLAGAGGQRRWVSGVGSAQVGTDQADRSPVYTLGALNRVTEIERSVT